MRGGRVHRLLQGVLFMQNIEAGSEISVVLSRAHDGATSPEPSRKRKSARFLKSGKERRIKELQQENTKLKLLVAELSLQKLTLRDILASKGL
jgi:hypothetical protein